MPISPAMLPTLMMLPLPRAAICGASAATRKYGAWTLAAKAAEGGRVEVRSRPEPGDPGAVDEHADRAGLLGEVVQLVQVAEVGGNETGLAALRRDRVGHRLAAATVPAVDDDLGAMPAEHFGCCLANARSGPGHQGTDALEVSLPVHRLPVHLLSFQIHRHRHAVSR